jgi:hypothetical protein
MLLPFAKKMGKNIILLSDAGTAQTADLPVATDRLPDELLGCWK